MAFVTLNSTCLMSPSNKLNESATVSNKNGGTGTKFLTLCETDALSVKLSTSSAEEMANICVGVGVWFAVPEESSNKISISGIIGKAVDFPMPWINPNLDDSES